VRRTLCVPHALLTRSTPPGSHTPHPVAVLPVRRRPGAAADAETEGI
jgi:hypothetical protein